MRNRQGITIAALIIAIIGLSIGFAAFSNTLTIRSSATVNPDQSALRVVFSLDDDSEVVGTTGSVTPDSNTYGDAGTINNTTQGNSKIEGLHAKFTEPGQSVKYNVSSANLYVYNAGSLQAQLTGVTFNNAQGVNTYKKCTAVTANKETEEIATDSLVQAACADITISVKVGNKVATPLDTSLNYQILGVGASLPVEITITYGGSTYVDGDFEVSFGDVVINATSAVDSSLVVTPSEPQDEEESELTESGLPLYVVSSSGEIISYYGSSTSVTIPSSFTVYQASGENTVYVDKCEPVYLYFNSGATDSEARAGCQNWAEQYEAGTLASNYQSALNYNGAIGPRYESTNQKVTITSIGNCAFCHKELVSVSIPNTVLTINQNAFGSNYLSSINIPSSVTTIGEGAFNRNNLATVTIGDSINNSNISSIDSYAFGDNQQTGQGGSYGPNEIENISIYAHENGVTVDSDAFHGFTGTVCWALDDNNCAN